MTKQKLNVESKDISSRNWCFTIFNYDDALIEHLKNLDKIKHCVFQEECCPSSGKKHLQGHVIWISVKTMSACKKALKSPTCHLEVMRGTPKQSTEYCTKDETHVTDGSRVEIGVCPKGKGTRSDLEECINRIRLGELKYNDIELDYPQLFVQYRNGLREICDKYHGKPRNFKSHVSVFYGKSGTGKSLKAFESSNDVYVLRCNKSQVWFDGYNYNDTLIIDDFYGWIPFNMLLNLLDRYSMKVDVKGGAMEFNSKNIIITSNKSPLEWYPNLSNEHKYALLRRLDNVQYFKRDGTYDVTAGITSKLEELMDQDDDENDELMMRTMMKKHEDEVADKSDVSILLPKSRHSTEVPPGNTILEDPSDVEENKSSKPRYEPVTEPVTEPEFESDNDTVTEPESVSNDGYKWCTIKSLYKPKGKPVFITLKWNTLDECYYSNKGDGFEWTDANECAFWYKSKGYEPTIRLINKGKV